MISGFRNKCLLINILWISWEQNRTDNLKYPEEIGHQLIQKDPIIKCMTFSPDKPKNISWECVNNGHFQC